MNLKDVSSPNYVIPLRTNPSWGLRDVFFTPGLHLIGDKLAFIKQMLMFETPTIGKYVIILDVYVKRNYIYYVIK